MAAARSSTPQIENCEDEDIEVELPAEVQVIERHKKRLLEEIKPTQLTPFLEDFLDKAERQNLAKVERKDGEPRAAFSFLDLIVGKEGFWEESLRALQEADFEDIADFLKEELTNVTTEQEASKKKSEEKQKNVEPEKSPPGVTIIQHFNQFTIQQVQSLQVGNENQAVINSASSDAHPSRPTSTGDGNATERTVGDEEDVPTRRTSDSGHSKQGHTHADLFFIETPTSEQVPEGEVPRGNTASQPVDDDETELLKPLSDWRPESNVLGSQPGRRNPPATVDEDETEVLKPMSDLSLKTSMPGSQLYTQNTNGSLGDDLTTDGSMSYQASTSGLLKKEYLTVKDLKHVELRNYQKELVKLPKEGHNCIVFAPPKSGKTEVAAEVCRHHFYKSVPRIFVDRKGPADQREKPNVKLSNCKVVYTVPHRPLLHQIYRRMAESLPLWRVAKKSGSSNSKTSLKQLLEVNDLIVVTPQILQNALENNSVAISDLTLLIMDECHHAKDDAPCNMIMTIYMKAKLNTQTRGLPQILGLTASPGTGRKDELSTVKEHLMMLCANLDITRPDCFVQVQEPNNVEEMKQYISRPVEETIHASKRDANPFQDRIQHIMRQIEAQVGVSGERQERGTQVYMSFITERKDECEDPKMRKHFEFLLHYNRGLEIGNVVQMKDGLSYIKEKHRDLQRRHEERGEDGLDTAEGYLLRLYNSNIEDLQEAVKREHIYPNPLLRELKEFIMKEFGDVQNDERRFRGIIFVQMVVYARALKEWVQDDPQLNRFLKPEVFIGKTSTDDRTGISDSSQREIMRKFTEGDSCNVLFSTSVGEEGIDIPDCNVVVRFKHVRDEVSMIQSSGRARAVESKSVLIGDEVTLTKDNVNVNRKKLMNEAAYKIGEIPPDRFETEILSTQKRLLRERENKDKGENEFQLSRRAEDVHFFCKGGCGLFACSKSQIRLYKGTHHVIPDPEFRDLIDLEENPDPKQKQFGMSDKMFCKKCRQQWGLIINGYPVISKQNFEVEINGRRKTYKKWKQIPGEVKPLN